MARVLIVAAHPDDEAVGCGGTVRRHALGGDELHAVFLTSGEAGGHGIEDAGALREREAHAAAEILGIGAIEFWHERDGRLRAGRSVVERLRAKLRALRPSHIYVPHEHDDHPDHRAAFRAVRRALHGARVRTTVYGSEIWSPISDIGEIVDISEQIDDKRAAIRAHASQCAVMPFDEAFTALARYRGEMHSWPGGPYAEVFTVTEFSSRS
jgi:LmbE family N-acetylglucosaminyl deacetylase